MWDPPYQHSWATGGTCTITDSHKQCFVCIELHCTYIAAVIDASKPVVQVQAWGWWDSCQHGTLPKFESSCKGPSRQCGKQIPPLVSSQPLTVMLSTWRQRQWASLSASWGCTPVSPNKLWEIEPGCDVDCYLEFHFLLPWVLRRGIGSSRILTWKVLIVCFSLYACMCSDFKIGGIHMTCEEQSGNSRMML